MTGWHDKDNSRKHYTKNIMSNNKILNTYIYFPLSTVFINFGIIKKYTKYV